MSPHWDFVYLLPHARFKGPIEHGPLALVPPGDGRLIRLAEASAAVKCLISRFTDQFGEKIEPSAILIRSDAPKDVDFYAVASFRNAIATSAILDGWSFELSGGRAGYPLWSDYFDLYPFTATKDGRLSAQSVASMADHHPEKFAGQRSPHLRSSKCLSFGIDEYVLEGIMVHWDSRFIQKRREWRTRVLFRSLEIACHASRVPAIGTRTPTVHDLGVGISLWVSALEILGHPRKGDVNLHTILDLLRQADWHHARLKTSRFELKCKKNARRINLIQKLYCELYRARNDFLHGNPVRRGSLFPQSQTGCVTLLDCAPLIYRTALMAFSGPKKLKISNMDVAAQIQHYPAFKSVQDRYEEAVLACKPTRRP